jgi:hypothetical protein
VWEGRQLVPADCVEASHTAQIQPEGDDDAYGYGWWISADGAYSAEGRGGQSIKLEPSLDVIVVTTGGGFDYDQQVDPLLSASLVDLEHALPANPAGVAHLEAAVTAIAQPPPAQAVAPLPAMARTVSGQTYVFEANPLAVDALRFVFDDSAEAQLHVTPAGGSEQPAWPIALDGVYRFSPGEFDLPQGLRGGWVDGQTFVFEYDEIANNDHAFFRIRFGDGRMQVQAQETAHALGVQVEGRLQTP